MSKYTLFFEKFANRKLARWELDVIAALEYIRQHGDNHRIVLVDPPGYDSRKLLCEYYQYLHQRIDPDGDFLVMAKTKRDAAILSGFISKPKTPWLTTASGNHSDNIRGQTFNYALLLDCHAYNSKAPKSARFAKNSTFNISHSKFECDNDIIYSIIEYVKQKFKNRIIFGYDDFGGKNKIFTRRKRAYAK